MTEPRQKAATAGTRFVSGAAVAKQAGLALVALAILPALFAQQAAQPKPVDSADQATPSIPVILFAFDRPGLPIPTYLMAIAQDGNGHYAGTEVPETPGNSAPAVEPQSFGRPFSVAPATAERILGLARNLQDFNVTCASNAKNIADTGKKKLTYSGPDGHGSCTYNYSDNKDVQAVTGIFQGIAETMDLGRRLDLLHRFDRLGLDDAMAFLADEVSHGRALEVVTIAPTLRSIADDAEVMQRVRARAKALLALIPADAQSR
jgi:hypothetical protein